MQASLSLRVAPATGARRNLTSAHRTTICNATSAPNPPPAAPALALASILPATTRRATLAAAIATAVAALPNLRVRAQPGSSPAAPAAIAAIAAADDSVPYLEGPEGLTYRDEVVGTGREPETGQLVTCGARNTVKNPTPSISLFRHSTIHLCCRLCVSVSGSAGFILPVSYTDPRPLKWARFVRLEAMLYSRM